MQGITLRQRGAKCINNKKMDNAFYKKVIQQPLLIKLIQILLKIAPNQIYQTHAATSQTVSTVHYLKTSVPIKTTNVNRKASPQPLAKMLTIPFVLTH